MESTYGKLIYPYGYQYGIQIKYINLISSPDKLLPVSLSGFPNLIILSTPRLFVSLPTSGQETLTPI